MTAPYTEWQTWLIVSTCGLIVIGTIVGNVLVCTAVAIVRRLRTPSNLLIVSLAVSDLLVAVLVMPLAAAYETTGSWEHGQPVCDMWTSLDVMLCTASILNLCAISIDRYFAITRPFQYAMKRTPGRMALMIVAAWALSALISIPPLFGWKADVRTGECAVSQAIGYQFYATFGAFYLPLIVMVVIYYRIYMVSSRLADAEARSKPFGLSRADSTQQSSSKRRPNPPAVDLGTTQHDRLSPFAATDVKNHAAAAPNVTDCMELQPTAAVGTVPDVALPPCNGSSHNKAASQRSGSTGCLAALRRCRRERSVRATSGGRNGSSATGEPGGATGGGSGGGGGGLAGGIREAIAAASRARSSTPSLSVKECKATRTLGVIMGAFTACWLPFFVLALVKPFCEVESECIPHWLSGLFLWLGYANSFLNPIIYARFNREFRTPFKEILLLRCRGINSRLRTETYVEQFGLALPRLGQRRPPAGTSVVAMAAAAAVHTVVQYQDALRRTSVRLRDHRLEASEAAANAQDAHNNGDTGGNDKPTEV